MSTFRAFLATAGVIGLIFLSRVTAFQTVDPVEARLAWLPVFMCGVALWFVAASNSEWKER